MFLGQSSALHWCIKNIINGIVVWCGSHTTLLLKCNERQKKKKTQLHKAQQKKKNLQSSWHTGFCRAWWIICMMNINAVLWMLCCSLCLFTCRQLLAAKDINISFPPAAIIYTLNTLLGFLTVSFSLPLVTGRSKHITPQSFHAHILAR